MTADNDEYIGPINGHTNRGPDIMANGCLWIAGIFFAFVAVFGAYGFYDNWRKPTADQLYGCTVEQRTDDGECK